MSKKLRRDPLYIAPDIIGWLDENYQPIIRDERSGKDLDPYNVEDKITIYERQVKEWFLKPAKSLPRSKNRSFIYLMVCLSYYEGVEQYKQMESSDGRSREFFVNAFRRMYPELSRRGITSFYTEARCGLFHNGMVKGKIVVSYKYDKPIDISDDGLTISVNPKLLMKDIEIDFNNFLDQLRNDLELQGYFNRTFTNV